MAVVNAKIWRVGDSRTYNGTSMGDFEYSDQMVLWQPSSILYIFEEFLGKSEKFTFKILNLFPIFQWFSNVENTRRSH